MTEYPGPAPEGDDPERGTEKDGPETSPGVIFNPQSAQPSHYPPAPGGYGQPWGQQPSPPYGQQPWGPPVPPRHGRAGTALALGLIAVVGALFSCGLSLLLAPVAWGLGHGALREIRASQGRWSGEGDARAGKVLGIIGTVLLVLAIIAAVAFFAWIGAEIDTYQEDSGTSV